MAHPGFSAAPQPHHHYPQSVPAPQQQDIASHMAVTYHQLGQLDPERRFPLDLVHILVRAASRDPAIALEVDYAMQRQFNQPPPPVAPPRTPQHMSSQMMDPPPGIAPGDHIRNLERGYTGGAPIQPWFTLGLPSASAAVRPSVLATVAGSATGAAMGSTASRSSPAAAAVRQVPAATTDRKRKRAAARETAARPPRSSRIGTKEWWSNAKEDDALMARMGMGLDIRRFI
ncbi:hypothetical protein PG996_003209 [Apiospora saccharicola]|uniref:Uncharacterized protein n=1 Tax=Apiospora saccharicola TaxID=335842 RepID=A0ABR1W0M1_9PEZI